MEFIPISIDDFNMDDFFDSCLKVFGMQKTTLYANFKHDILTSNRFIPSQNIIDFLNELRPMLEKNTENLCKGSKLFRARLSNDELKKELVKRFLDTASKGSQERTDLLSESIINSSLFEHFAKTAWINRDTLKNLPLQELHTCLNNFLNQDFQGFSKEKCSAPPAASASEGRLNPKNVSYLYTAQDCDTALYEVKPILGQKISLATLETNKDLKVLNLAENTYSELATKNFFGFFDYTEEVPSIIQVVAEQFEKPNHYGDEEYLPTQYIAEYAKEVLKLDGIKFKSSLHKGGINIVLFDTDSCNMISSKIYSVDNIEIISHKIEDDLTDI